MINKKENGYSTINIIFVFTIIFIILLSIINIISISINRETENTRCTSKLIKTENLFKFIDIVVEKEVGNIINNDIDAEDMSDNDADNTENVEKENSNGKIIEKILSISEYDFVLVDILKEKLYLNKLDIEEKVDVKIKRFGVRLLYKEGDRYSEITQSNYQSVNEVYIEVIIEASGDFGQTSCGKYYLLDSSGESMYIASSNVMYGITDVY